MPKDIYSNLAYQNATEAVAGTAVFNPIQSGVAIFEKTAWLINRIEYFFSTDYMNLLLDEADSISAGVTVSDAIDGFGQADPSLIDHVRVGMRSFGVAANDQLYRMPLISNLSTLPGGGILVSPSPLYVGVKGISLAAVASVQVRIYFIYIQLKPDEYWEMVESRRIIS